MFLPTAMAGTSLQPEDSKVNSFKVMDHGSRSH